MTNLERMTKVIVATLEGVEASQVEPKAAFIDDLTGSHAYIADYLTQEVLDQQPKELRRFLLQTSILRRFCGPLCEAVTGQSDGQWMLEALAEAN